MAINGMRGSDSYGNQRPGNFSGGIKRASKMSKTRITRNEMSEMMSGVSKPSVKPKDRARKK